MAIKPNKNIPIKYRHYIDKNITFQFSLQIRRLDNSKLANISIIQYIDYILPVLRWGVGFTLSFEGAENTQILWAIPLHKYINDDTIQNSVVLVSFFMQLGNIPPYCADIRPSDKIWFPSWAKPGPI